MAQSCLLGPTYACVWNNDEKITLEFLKFKIICGLADNGYRVTLVAVWCLLSVRGRADGSPLFLLAEAWLGGQSCFVPRIHKKSDQIQAVQQGRRTERELQPVVPPTDLPSSTGHRGIMETHLLPFSAAGAENVTQGPASCVASLPWEPPQCANMGWIDEREREVGQLEHCEERWK